MATTNISIPMTEEYKTQLDELAAATGRSRNHHLTEAVRRYLAEEGWHVAKIRQGLGEADAGLGYEHNEIEAEMRQLVAKAQARLAHGDAALDAGC
ncbi:MAG: ribbon-helix-helix protein CopG family [Chloroflexi bacterium]|nr:ribbon-helix-helix protein CopG family [Chloroflexota bacterium]